jgi:hypothetical protein
MPNSMMEIWASGGETLGTWLSMPTTHAAEICARTGFDYVCVDMQHGTADYQIAVSMIQAIELGGKGTPIVRVPWNEPGIIGRMMDAGARGVIIPMVNSPEEAQAAVNAVKYPPIGARSFGPIMIGAREGAGYFERANDITACIPMIETKQPICRSAMATDLATAMTTPATRTPSKQSRESAPTLELLLESTPRLRSPPIVAAKVSVCKPSRATRWQSALSQPATSRQHVRVAPATAAPAFIELRSSDHE